MADQHATDGSVEANEADDDESTTDGEGSPLYDLTAFQRDCLVVIERIERQTGESPYGLAIKEALEGVYELDINHGRLYPNLSELADRSLVEVGSKDDRTNEYSITQRGKRELELHRQWVCE